MTRSDRFIKTIFSKDVCESSFKLLSFVVIASTVLNLIKIPMKNESYAIVAGMALLFFILVAQAFSYGVQTIGIPLCEAIWPNANYLKTMQYIHQQPKEKRDRIFKNIRFSKPLFGAFIAYILFFYYVNGLVSLVVEYGKIFGKAA